MYQSTSTAMCAKPISVPLDAGLASAIEDFGALRAICGIARLLTGSGAIARGVVRTADVQVGAAASRWVSGSTSPKVSRNQLMIDAWSTFWFGKTCEPSPTGSHGETSIAGTRTP